MLNVYICPRIQLSSSDKEARVVRNPSNAPVPVLHPSTMTSHVPALGRLPLANVPLKLRLIALGTPLPTNHGLSRRP